MAKPLIGITTYVEPASLGRCGQLEAALIPYAYVQAVERAGGRALLVPPSEDGVEETLDALDGLLLLRRQRPRSRRRTARRRIRRRPARTPERDRGELALLEAALARDMPVLAICRGFQVLNVARGGDLVQHLPEVVGDEEHREVLGDVLGARGAHRGRLEARRDLGESRPGEVAPPPGRRHESAKACARSPGPRTARSRGSRIPTRRFAVGVLWHPEAGEDQRLFEELVAEARAYREERR